MTLNRSAKLAVLLTALAILTSACATKGYNKGEYNLLSVKQEEEWGDQLKVEVDGQLRAKGMDYPDSEVQAYIDDLGQRLLLSAPEVNFDYTFTVIRSEQINAFALPGGHVYVNTGLIALADNEAELAGVLSHEIGHIVARHSSERLSAILTAQFVGNILVASQTRYLDRVLTDLAVQIVTQTSGLAYSRADENEADLIGVEMMYDANYDPRALQRFFQKLRDENGDMNEAQIFFSTHPDPKDRRSRVRDYIQSIDLHDGMVLDSTRFQKVHAKCKALHPELE